MQIRPIRNEELPQLLALYRFLNSEDPEIQITEEIEDKWQQIFNDPNLHYFVGEENGKLVSSCVLAIILNLTRGAKSFGIIQNVVTEPNYRGKGFGSDILRHANEFAWSQDCYQVLLQTGRPETYEFYRSLGFRDDVKNGFVIKPKWTDS